VRLLINTYTTVRNDDVIVRQWKMPFSQEEREFRIHSASIVAFKFAGFKSSWLQCMGRTAREGVQKTCDWHWSRRPQAPHKNCGLSWITPSFQLLCISGAVVSQCPSRPATVISSTVFDLDIVFAAITATFLAVVDQSSSCTLIGRFGSIAVVSIWLCALQYMIIV